MQRRTLLGSLAAAAVGSAVPASASSGPQKGGNRPSPPSSSNSARNSDILPTGTERIAETFYNQVEQELHHGAQLAVYHKDELVLNIAGGTTGPDGAEEKTDTRHILFSTTKPYTAGTVHYLVDEGLVEYDDYVVDHWPEFARGDERKEEVTIRHVLSHQSGLHSIPAIDDNPEIWGSPDKKEALVENAKTEYEPGTRTDYHLLSYGWIIDGLTRNVVGKQIDELAEEAIFDPLGMDNTSIGVADASEVDVATLVGFEPYNQITEPNSPRYTSEVAALFNWDYVQESVVGAATGIGTARDLARYYNCLLNNGEDVFSNQVARAFTSVEVEQEDGEYTRRGLGVRFGGEPGDDFGVTASHGVYGHGGLGSIMTWADPDNDIAFAYVTNGIRDGYEHSQRVARLGDTVRHELS